MLENSDFNTIGYGFLLVKMLVLSDMGPYQCFAENSLGKVQATAELAVYMKGKYCQSKLKLQLVMGTMAATVQISNQTLRRSWYRISGSVPFTALSLNIQKALSPFLRISLESMSFSNEFNLHFVQVLYCKPLAASDGLNYININALTCNLLSRLSSRLRKTNVDLFICFKQDSHFHSS